MRGISFGKLHIGNVTLDNPFILAPMAGVTDMPYRRICSSMGAGLVCMEMISAKGILYDNKNTKKLLTVSDDEHPVSVQLFGSEPEVFEKVIPVVSDLSVDIIDINMGCPVPKIVRNNEGSALLKDPVTAGHIIESVKKSTDKPVTVKIRKGFALDDDNAVEMAHVAESSGADAIILHGRTREQYYSGEADWEAIRRVKAAVKIPLIGNGDLRCASDVLRMKEQTGCDGFAIGRAAMGNPFIFEELNIELIEGKDYEKPDYDRVADVLLAHARDEIEFKGEYTGVREMRRHGGYYLSHFKGSKEKRKLISQAGSYRELFAIVKGDSI